MQPKFKVGDKVKATSRRRNKVITGAIVEVARCFAQVDAHGKFVRGGLVWDERDIKSISVPHTFDGQTLSYDCPAEKFAGGWSRAARTESFRFRGYAYTIESEVPGDCRYGFDEKQIKVL